MLYLQIQSTLAVKIIPQSSCSFLKHYLYLHPCAQWIRREIVEKKQPTKQTWFFSMQSCFLFFLSGTSEHNQPQSRFVHLLLCMHPSCLFCCYLLMGFLFCITRTNLIRAEGIQISVHPPNAIWSSNKGLGERKERITNVFSRGWRENRLRNVSLLTNECNFTKRPYRLKWVEPCKNKRTASLVIQNMFWYKGFGKNGWT